MNGFISGTEARKMIKENGAILIDVRNPGEFANGSAPGAINIPVSMIPHKARELDAEKQFILFCVSGARSAQAHMILQSMGFNHVRNAGGLQHYMNS